MADNREENKGGRVINTGGGPYYEHADYVVNHFYNGVRQEPRGQQAVVDIHDAALMRDLLVPVIHEIKNSRQWFSVYRVMVDAHYIKAGDLEAFEQLLKHIYDGKLPHAIDLHDLAKMEVQGFAKPFSEWSLSSSPVTGKTFYQYYKIARITSDVLGIEL